MCIWVTVRLICFRARARNRNRNRERREADYDYEHEYEYEYECDSYVESCNPELNQAENRLAPACPELAEGFTSTLRSRATAEDGSLTQTAKTQRKSKRQALSRETLASLEYVTERLFQRRMLKRVAPVLQYPWCHAGAGQ